MLKNRQSVGLILVVGALCFSGGIHAELAPIKQEAHVSQQSGKVSGTVEDDLGPVTGASVLIKGTTNGTITDLDGNFILDGIKQGDVIVISFIGYVPQEIVYNGQSILNISLREDTQLLDEVVVTALGIKREKKALGYATQELKGDALVNARESNLANALSGKVSGLQVVRSSAGPGGSSKIVLRGNSSLTGSNQPLIVIDGVPMDNFTGGVDDPYGNNGKDMGNGLSDINPEDIESMSVLKGASAAALYGSRAGNGVILITTKSGKKQPGLGITVTAGLTTETMFLKPKMQNEFGQGSYNTYDKTARTSWGPRADGHMVENWDGTQVPFRTYDNIGNYFQTGTSFNEGISFQQSYDGTSVYASINRSDDKGIVPGAKLNNTSITLRGTTEFGPDRRWRLDAKANYINNYVKNRPLQGINQSNAFRTLYMLPRSIDIRQLEHCVDEVGDMIWWDDKQTPQENPYWTRQYRTNEDTRNRFIGSMSLSYKITDWWNIELRGGTDYYTTTTEEKLHWGSMIKPRGDYRVETEGFYENNYSFLTTLQKDNLLDKLGVAFTFGGNLMMQERRKTKIGTGDLLIRDVFTLTNALNKQNLSPESEVIRRKMNSLYGTLQFNWDGWLFMDVTGRNDWSSTMSKENRSYFYPSVSLSGVVSEMVHRMDKSMPEWFTFAKVRASYAQVGNDLDPYKLYTNYKINTDALGKPVGELSEVLYNPAVRSELIKSWEVGFETKFFNNRLGIDAAWYKMNATRQLLEIPVDPFTGYLKKQINAGNIQNEGIELMVYATPVETATGFSWETTLNASRNKNKIIDLIEGVTEYNLRTFEEISIVARTGGDYGDIYGRTFKRVEEGVHAGKMVVDDGGLPIIVEERSHLGNQQPNWMVGWSNTFNYKNISLGFLLDARIGGHIYSATTAYMYATGNAAGTVINGQREDFVVDAVVEGANGYETNTVKVSPERYWDRVAGHGNTGTTEAFLKDATNIRLRNVTLSYDLEKKWLTNTPLQRVRLSFVMNNVWMIKYHMEGIDPESVSATNTNASGFENVSAPSSRSYTFNVTVSF